jgi:hypothetical protein
MSLWRRTRSEVAGAWRSLRYDLGRRPPEPPADGPDVTSTGMCTFGVPVGVADPVAPVARRPPRRAAAVSAFGLLTVVGAAGAYLAVVNGLGSLLNEQTAAAGTLPPATAATSATADSGIGPSTRRPRVRAAPAPTPKASPTPEPARTMLTPPARPAGPVRTKKACGCGDPPVPTPTAPASTPSPTPSETASASDSPTPGESSATPGESPEPSGSPAGRHRRRHY